MKANTETGSEGHNRAHQPPLQHTLRFSVWVNGHISEIFLPTRNSEGSFLHGSSRWLPTVALALGAEAEACQDGLHLSLERGFSRVRATPLGASKWLSTIKFRVLM
jgi:hypothetical protein